MCGVPPSWNKTAGGDTVARVGFELLHRSYKLRISQKRAEWFIRWTCEVAATDYVLMSNFEEGLGRIMYVAGALEIDRPFLALFKSLNLHPRDAVRPGMRLFHTPVPCAASRNATTPVQRS